MFFASFEKMALSLTVIFSEKWLFCSLLKMLFLVRVQDGSFKSEFFSMFFSSHVTARKMALLMVNVLFLGSFISLPENGSFGGPIVVKFGSF